MILLVAQCDGCKIVSAPMEEREIPQQAYQVMIPGSRPTGLVFCSSKCLSEFFKDNDGKGGPSTKHEDGRRLGFDTTVAVSRPEGFIDDPDEISRRLAGLNNE